jgi:hypothetical protein
MKLTKIPYQEGWLYVDKEADYELNELITSNAFGSQVVVNSRAKSVKHGFNIQPYKIVAQSPNLNLPNIPYIEDVEEKPEYNWAKGCYEQIEPKDSYSEADVRAAIQMARETVPNRLNHPEDGFESEYDEEQIIASLNQPQDRYSEADVLKIVTKVAMDVQNDGFGSHSIGHSYANSWVINNESFLQSLNQPQEIEIEMDTWDGEPSWMPITYQKDGKTFLKVKQ